MFTKLLAISIVDNNQFGFSNCCVILLNALLEVFFNLFKSFADKLKKATSLAEIIPEQNNKNIITRISVIRNFVLKVVLSKIVELIKGSGSKTLKLIKMVYLHRLFCFQIRHQQNPHPY